ncbi:alpha/beta hydrolase [Flagellimonas sp.]|uniref:alpha/beta hydrolase n=1 Tax=Flagellimonas sp. TaxID=2058762 RepID=UPI003BAC65FC
MGNTIKSNWVNVWGAILILTGGLSIFLENGTWPHTTLQVVFVVGCILFIVGGRLYNKLNCSFVALVLMLSISFPDDLSAQDYSQQVKAFEASFNKNDISPIQPYLSDSLKFAPLPVQNTIPILTNIVTKLPELNALQILSSEKGKVSVQYDFQQLGTSESQIHFDGNGRITKIELVENLIGQEIEQQRKMQSSIKAPQPDKIAFNYSKKNIEFPSKDGLIISADLYEVVDPNKPIILLCHQAGYNKYEYADIAPRLNKMGFNALAIDQRSGGSFADMQNETYNRAIKNGSHEIDFTDAIQDIESAINYLSGAYKQKVIVWGSSYSSALALHIAEKNKNIKAVISFSPGDYFGDQLPSLKKVFPKIKQPFLVTSSKAEAAQLKGLLSNVKPTNHQSQFVPTSDGFHGSKALWIDQKGSDEYWNAINSFLTEIN